MEPEQTVRLAHILPRCSTLGPGSRAVVWVAGCTRRCPGCIAEPIIGPEAGSDTPVDELVARLLTFWPFDGLTLSGGEPFEQSEALVALIDGLRSTHDISVMAYSGFRLEELVRSPDLARRALLARLDILIDGPFMTRLQGSFLWRGSSNQKIHLLTGRHAKLASKLDGPSVGLEVHLDHENRLFWAGIPPVGFSDRLSTGLAARGIELSPEFQALA